MIAERFDLGDLRDCKRFHLQPGPQPLVFRSRGLNDDVAVEKPHSSRPQRRILSDFALPSCRVGDALDTAACRLRRSASSVFTAWSVSPESPVPWRADLSFRIARSWNRATVALKSRRPFQIARQRIRRIGLRSRPRGLAQRSSRDLTKGKQNAKTQTRKK
jgi:hypothetical protein